MGPDVWWSFYRWRILRMVVCCALLTMTMAYQGTVLAAADARQEAWAQARYFILAGDADGLKKLAAAPGGLAAIDPPVRVVEGGRAPGGGRVQYQFEEGGLMAFAAVYGAPETIRVLHALGVSLHGTDRESGYTPLMRALAAGRVDNAAVLRDLGSDLDWVAHDGYMPVTLAEQLGEADFEPTQRPRLMPLLSGQEAAEVLLLAADAGDLQAAQLAVQEGALPNASASNGWTALQFAAFRGHSDIVEYLVSLEKEHGMPVTRADGEDPVLIALAGEGMGDHDKVRQVLALLKVLEPKQYAERQAEYDLAAARIGYSDTWRKANFRQGYDMRHGLTDHSGVVFLPAPPYEPPVDGDADVTGWKRVQQMLKSEGLYSGAIDGKPGQSTAMALYAYVAPLEDFVMNYAAWAAKQGAADAAASKGGAQRQGPHYGVSSVICGELGAVDEYGVAEAAGYVMSSTQMGDVTIEKFMYAPLGMEVFQMKSKGRVTLRSFKVPLLGGWFTALRTAGTTEFGFDDKREERKFRFVLNLPNSL